jgi:hypothetical protein
MVAFSVKIVVDDGNCMFRNLAILLETVSCYFVLRYHISNAETLLCCTEYSHWIRWNSTGTYAIFYFPLSLQENVKHGPKIRSDVDWMISQELNRLDFVHILPYICTVQATEPEISQATASLSGLISKRVKKNNF